MLLWPYLRADKCHLLAYGEPGFIGKWVTRILIQDKTLYLLILMCFGSLVQWEHLNCQPLDTHASGKVSSHRAAVRMMGIIQLGKEQLSYSATAEDFNGSWNGQSIFPHFSCLSSFLFCSMGLLFLLRQKKNPKVPALEGHTCSCSFVWVQIFWPFDQPVAAGKEFRFYKPIVYPALLLFLSHLLPISVSNTCFPSGVRKQT